MFCVLGRELCVVFFGEKKCFMLLKTESKAEIKLMVLEIWYRFAL